MEGGIFLIQDDESLIEMKAQEYDSEDLLQALLAKYPNLLAGDQIDQTVPRRWMLISRELPIPFEEDTTGRLSVDHFFLDQDSIPTFVEVKRSSDTRLRREVVGQMLDYVANAVVNLKVETLQARFETNCTQRGEDPTEVLADFIGDDGDSDEFWATVKANLQSGKVRMLFVADEIPSELRQVVEFLNEQMRLAEVLAVEIKQYAGEGLKTLVPRVIGQTAVTERSKGSRQPGKQWDEATFFTDLEARREPAEAEVARKLLVWAQEKMPDISWGKGEKDGSFTPLLSIRDVKHKVISVYTYGRVELIFQHMKPTPPFDSPETRLELLRRYNQIPGISVSEDKINSRPSIPLETLIEGDRLQQFIGVLDWVVDEVTKSEEMNG